MRAVGLPPIVALTILRWQGGYQAAGQARGQRGDDAIKAPGALISSHLPAPLLRLYTLDAGAEQHFAAQRADAFNETLVELLEAAFEVAQARRAVVKSSPEPG